MGGQGTPPVTRGTPPVTYGGVELEVKICKNLEKSGLGLCHETGVKTNGKTRVKTRGGRRGQILKIQRILGFSLCCLSFHRFSKVRSLLGN